MFLTIAEYYCRMLFIRKIDPHTITGAKMANKLDLNLLGRATISATAIRRKKLIEEGFTDESTLQILSEGNSDRTAEDIVAQIMREGLTNCVFHQKEGHSGTSCDLITETGILSKHRVEVKSAKQHTENGEFGLFKLQGIKPDLFDIIFFVMFGTHGTSIEMMSKKQYVKHFGYSDIVNFRNTAISNWKPSVNKDGSIHRASAWCNNDNARHKNLTGHGDVLRDCLADDFETYFNLALSHKRKLDITLEELHKGCPA